MSRTAALGVLAVLLAAVFVRLGLWQLDRAAERRSANERISTKLAEPPIRPAGSDWGAGRTVGVLAYRRAEATGAYDFGREIVARGRAWEGTPGVELLTPLVLETGGELWVNRGWIPAPDAATVDQSRFREPGRVRVRGYLRPPRAGEVANGRSPTLVLEQAPDSVETGRPPVAAPFPRRRGAPELSGGPHLSYAVQWFAFAAIALVGYGAFVWSRKRGSAAPAGEPPPRGLRSNGET